MNRLARLVCSLPYHRGLSHNFAMSAITFTFVLMMAALTSVSVSVNAGVVKRHSPAGVPAWFRDRLSPLQTTTTPWVTTTPPSCWTDDGQQLFPGQDKTIISRDGCQMCSCSYWGHLQCTYADCLVPMCTNAHRAPGQCCADCPHGPNCRIPTTGEVIPAGQLVERQGMICECPPQSYRLPGIQTEADYTAICIPATTIPTTIITTIPTAIPTTTPPGVPVGRR